jgi:hypothetical protein
MRRAHGRGAERRSARPRLASGFLHVARLR